MLRLRAFMLVLFSANTFAQTEVPNVFVDGEVIDAERFNQNFDALEDAIDAIPSGPVVGPQGATGP